MNVLDVPLGLARPAGKFDGSPVAHEQQAKNRQVVSTYRQSAALITIAAPSIRTTTTTKTARDRGSFQNGHDRTLSICVRPACRKVASTGCVLGLRYADPEPASTLSTVQVPPCHSIGELAVNTPLLRAANLGTPVAWPESYSLASNR